MEEEKAPVRIEETPPTPPTPPSPPMPPVHREEERQGYRSLFWPIVLVGVGAIWLLINLNVVQSTSLSALWRLWPILLILAGIDIIFGRLSRFLGVLLGLATIALVVGVLIMAPALGWADQGSPSFFGLPFSFGGTDQLKSDQFSTAVGSAEAAQIELDLGRWATQVSALSGGDNLIEADVDYTGQMVFDVRGDRTKSVTLREENPVPFMDFGVFSDARWEIGLAPDVPMELSISGGSGSSDLDLSSLSLTRFEYDGGSGSNETRLPASEERYEANLSTGSGSVNVEVADGTQVDLELDSGSGSVSVAFGENVDATVGTSSGSGSLSIDVPDGAAVRIEVQSDGSGSFNPGPQFDQVESGEDETGTWETPGFAGAEHQIVITVHDAGSGSISIH